jgi:hypothetical protein
MGTKKMYLMPLSTLLHLYCGVTNWSYPEKTMTLPE